MRSPFQAKMHPMWPDPDSAHRRLRDYLYHSIPLIRHMEVEVCPIEAAGIRLRAPLAPNSNHIGTAFGGSLHGLATLACWGLVWLVLERIPHTRIVIQESRMNYLRPVDAGIEAFSPFPPEAELHRFADRVARRGRARLSLQAVIRNDGHEAATFQGRFVALVPHAAADTAN